MSVLSDMLDTLTEQPKWTDQQNHNFFNFVKANKKDMKFYSVADVATGDTFLIIRWPHKVPGLVVLP